MQEIDDEGRIVYDGRFDELTSPDLCVENRSRSAFPNRSAAEYRVTLEELTAMVASTRGLSSVMRWLSPTCVVARCDRDGVGHDGEQYTWCWLIVFEVRDRRVASCQFELDDEEAAFAYAEGRISTPGHGS